MGNLTVATFGKYNLAHLPGMPCSGLGENHSEQDRYGPFLVELAEGRDSI